MSQGYKRALLCRTKNRPGIAETRELRNHFQSRLEREGNSGRRSTQGKRIDKIMR